MDAGMFWQALGALASVAGVVIGIVGLMLSRRHSAPPGVPLTSQPTAAATAVVPARPVPAAQQPSASSRGSLGSASIAMSTVIAKRSMWLSVLAALLGTALLTLGSANVWWGLQLTCDWGQPVPDAVCRTPVIVLSSGAALTGLVMLGVAGVTARTAIPHPVLAAGVLLLPTFLGLEECLGVLHAHWPFIVATLFPLLSAFAVIGVLALVATWIQAGRLGQWPWFFTILLVAIGAYATLVAATLVTTRLMVSSNYSFESGTYMVGVIVASVGQAVFNVLLPFGAVLFVLGGSKRRQGTIT